MGQTIHSFSLEQGLEEPATQTAHPNLQSKNSKKSTVKETSTLVEKKMPIFGDGVNLIKLFWHKLHQNWQVSGFISLFNTKGHFAITKAW